MLAVANHLSSKATLTVPTVYCTLALNGVEVSGLTRQTFLYDDPDDVSSTEIMMKNLTAISIPTPDGSADEAWVMTAASGGVVWFRCPFDSPITLVDGTNKTFAPGELTHLMTNTTPAAP